MRLFRSITAAAAMLLLSAATWAASFQIASVLVDTEANVVAKTGLYTGQEAILTDRNSIKKVWNGSAWKLARTCQLLAYSHTAVTTAGDTATNTAFTATLPAMGANDYVRVEFGWSHTSSANNKVYSVEVDGSTMYTNTVTTTTMLHSFTMIHQRNATNAQVAMGNVTAGYGTSSGTIQTGTRDLSSAGKTITVRSAKASGGETTTLEYADAFVCGGG
jgi:hypothetical protein